MKIDLDKWQIDLILDGLSLLEDLESGNGTNDDYDPDPINQTVKDLLSFETN